MFSMFSRAGKLHSPQPTSETFNMKAVFTEGDPAKMPAAIEQFLAHYSLCPPYPKGPDILILASSIFRKAEVTNEARLVEYADYFGKHLEQSAASSQNSELHTLALWMKNATSADTVMQVLQDQIKVQLFHWEQMQGCCLLFRNIEVACRFLQVKDFNGLKELSIKVAPLVDNEWTVWVKSTK